MKLYVGGAYQGQAELAVSENPGMEVLEDFHEIIRQALERGEDIRQFAEEVCRRHQNAVIVANEVGAGVVPVSAADRAFREAVGRVLCLVAQRSETVTRVVCGIGVRIK